MQTTLRHCVLCDRNTEHIIATCNSYGNRGFQRVIDALTSVGTSEIDSYEVVICTECGAESYYNDNNLNLV